MDTDLHSQSFLFPDLIIDAFIHFSYFFIQPDKFFIAFLNLLTVKIKIGHIQCQHLYITLQTGILQFFLAKIPYGTIRKIIQIFLFPYF